MNRETILWVKSRLGDGAVLLPIRRGTKKPTRNGWNRLSPAETQTRQYQRCLANADTIGVALGGQSGNLCTIDIDRDELVDPFLNDNPMLRGTLRTRGRRGCNLWVRVIGEYPSTCELKTNGKHAGEWRSNGAQTIIAGEHPEGGRYSVLVDAQPVEIEFGSIEWGAFDAVPFYSSVLSVSSVSATSAFCTSTASANDPVARLLIKKDAEQRLRSDSRLQRLHNRYIARRFMPKAGDRNAPLVAMVTFLHRAVSPETVVRLAMLHYQLNADVFGDSEQQHAKELDAHLRAVEETWLAELTSDERALYLNLGERTQAAFRICRDLADHGEDSGRFFLSCKDLADRIATTQPAAHRVLQALCGLGILEMERKGARWSKGKPPEGRASEWRYLHPQPPQSDAGAG